jgi:hypothetical protein
MEVIELEPEPIPLSCPTLIDLSSPQKETVCVGSPRASIINPVVSQLQMEQVLQVLHLLLYLLYQLNRIY